MPERDASVEVELDADDPVVLTPSDTVTGTVHVDVHQDVTCGGLTVKSRWEARGRGEEDTGIAEETMLFQGAWGAGDSRTYSFELTLPPGPYTYRGEQLDIRWVVEADADLTMLVSSGDTAEFVLEPGGAEEYLDGTGQQTPSARSDSPLLEPKQIVALIVGLPLLISGIALLIAPPAMDGYKARAVGVICGIFGALGIGLTGWALRNALAMVWIGNMDLSVPSREVAPGEKLTGRLTIEPTAGGVTIDRVTFRLHGYEEITKSTGSSGAVKLHEPVYSKELTPAETTSLSLEAHTESTYEVEFELPETDAYSFEAFDTSLHWELEAHVEAAHWLDWKQTVPLVLRPTRTDT
jgi:hypothetical protein